MNNKVIITLFVFCCFNLGCVTHEQANSFTYEIMPPSLPEDHVGVHRMYFLPVRDKFAANISVMTQPFDNTIEFYEREMKDRDQRKGNTTIISIIDNGFLTRESIEKPNDETTHWYQRAIVKDDMLYMITATGRDKHWEEQAPYLKACVDSFKLK